MPRLAVYPGSFDPPTLGHLDVIERAAGIFDEVVVSIGVNPKKKPFLATEARLEALRQSANHLKNVRVDQFQGLLMVYAESLGAQAVVRGLRGTADFDFEFQMAMVHSRLLAKFETVFLMAKAEHGYLSSSIVREVAQLGGDYREMVPPPVAEIIEAALRQQG